MTGGRRKNNGLACRDDSKIFSKGYSMFTVDQYVMLTACKGYSRAAWLSAMLFCCLLLNACNSTSKVNRPAVLKDIINQRQITTTWTQDIGGGKQLFFSPQMAIDEHHIYAANSKQVMAVDKATGAYVWVKEFPSRITGATGQGGKLVLAGDENGMVYALDRNNGDLLWSYRVDSEVLSPPQANSQIVVVISGSGKVYGLSPQDGKQQWLLDTIKPILLRSGSSAATLSDKAIYIGQDNGKVLAIDAADGKRLWEARVAIPKGDNELERLVDIDASPLYHNGIVYAASFQGGLMAIDTATGKPLWAQKNSSSNEIGAYRGMLVITDVEANIRAYNVANGTLIWENNDLSYRRLGNPQVTSDYVTLLDYRGYLHVLSRQTSSIIARQRIGKVGIDVPMLQEGNRLFILDRKGKLRAVDIVR